MITFDELTKANKEIITMPITRKDKKTGKETTKEYAQVHQRVKVFRMLYPNGCIETELVSINEQMVIFRAVVKDEEGKILGTGTAYEEKKSSFINETSYLENAETSSIGRALATCGIGIDLSMASYEEVSNAQLNQEPEKKAQKQDVKKAEAEEVKETPKPAQKKAAFPPREKMLEVAYKHFPAGSKNLANLLKGNNLDSLENATDSQLMSVYSRFGGK